MPTAYADINPTTYSGLKAATPSLQGQAWKLRFYQHAGTKDLFSHLEGPDGSQSAIRTHSELRAAPGDRINFHHTLRLGGTPKRGEARSQGHEERMRMNGDHVLIDYMRHQTSFTKAMVKKIPGGREFDMWSHKLLGEHCGLWKQRDAMQRLIRGAGTSNRFFGGDAPSLATLKSAGVLTPDFVSDLAGTASLAGVEPVSVDPYGKVGCQDVHKHILVADDSVLRPMRSHLDYQNAAHYADVRGKQNMLFSGAYREWDGTAFYDFRSVDEDTHGPLGTPMRPWARLGAAIADGDGQAVVLTGHGGTTGADVDDPMYFVDFPGYDYRFTEEQAAAPDGSTHYFLTYNKATNKFGFGTYVGSANDGYKITTSARITAAVPSIGSVNNGAGVWSGLLAGTYAAGDPVWPCNILGVPFAWSFFLGAGALNRAYGEECNFNTKVDDYGMVTGKNYEIMFGQNTSLDAQNRPRNYLIAATALQLASVPFPTVS